MKFNFRKIASAIASSALIGSTIGLALAASYTAPFVQNGAADVGIVYGSNAAPSDLVAAAEISANLGSALTAQGGGGGTVVIEGDSILLARSSDNLNLRDNLDGPFGATVDDEDLDLLADGTYVAEDSDTFDYEQKITLGSIHFDHFQDSDYEDLLGLSDRTPVVGIKINDTQIVMNYSLEFTDDAESDVVGTSSGGDLDDLEGSFLPLLGKSFYVSDWKNGTSTEMGTGKLTLLDTGVKGVVKEGESQSLTLGTTSYDVSIDYIDADSTALSVNGLITSDLKEGETEKLPDGTYVGITDVRRLEVGGEVGTVEFSLGSGKLELEHKTDIKINGDSVSNLKSYLYHSSGSNNIDKLAIEWKADDDLFITPESEITLPGFGGIKFAMTDFVRGEGEEMLSVKNSGKDKLELKVPIKDGDATIGLLYENTTAGWIGIGEETTKRLATSPQNDMMFWNKKNGNNHHSYFVATYAGTKDAQSYLLDFSVGTDGTAKEVDVINKVTGLTVASDKKNGDTVTIGDVQFTIQNITENSQNKSVNITAGTNVNFNTVYTTGGLKIYLPYSNGGTDILVADSEASENGPQHNIYYTGSYATAGLLNLTGDGSDDTASSAGHNNATWYLTMDGEDKDDTLGSGTGFELRLSADLGSGNEVEVDQANLTSLGTFAVTGGSRGIEAEAIGENVYQAYVFDDVAPRLLHYTNGDQDTAEVYYPTGNSETYGVVYLASESASTGGAGELGKVLFDDSDVGMVSGKNLIVVGGSCINSVAQALLDSTSPVCGAAFTAATNIGAGEFLIKTYNSPFATGKIATLVAGYEAGDTTNAVNFLTTEAPMTDVGKAYVGTSATSAELQI